MKNKLIKLFTVIIAIIGLTNFALAPVYADSCTDPCDKGCSIPDEIKAASGCPGYGDTNDHLADTAINILNGILGILAVVAVVVIVIGGIRFMTSAGDANKAKQAKNTILYACIGLVVAALAGVIVNFVAKTLIIKTLQENSGSDLPSIIIGIINNALGILAAVAVVIIVISGVRFMTSAGDASKVKSAKDTILYACIGLAVIALAAIIVNFVIKTILAQGTA